MVQNFLQKKLIHPIVKLLRMGITPGKISLGLAVGVVAGIFPVIGATTALSTLAALLLRLNLPAVQLVNYLVYPLQIALIIPFFQMGAWLFGVEPLDLSLQQLIGMVEENPGGAIRQLWRTTLRAIVAWSLIGPPVAAALFLLFRWIVQRLVPNRASRPPGAAVRWPDR